MKTKYYFICILLLLLVGCNKSTQTDTTLTDGTGAQVVETSPADSDFISVLETSQDYFDFKADFQELTGRDFVPVVVEKILLDKASTDAKIDEWMKSNSTSPYVEIFDGLVLKDKQYYLYIEDALNKQRSVMAIIDMDQQTVVKFYALVKLKASMG